MRKITKVVETTEYDDGLYLSQMMTEEKDGIIFVRSFSFEKVILQPPTTCFGRYFQDSPPSRVGSEPE